MDQKILNLLLKNYNDLLKRVDAHIQQVEKDYSDKIVCKKGCDSCCRFLNLFPVEAFALSAAFIEMDKSRRHLAMDEAGKKNNGEKMVDFCPKNFKDMTSFPREALFDLEQLNTLLAAINKQFLDSVETDIADRIPMSRALLLLDKT